MFSQEQNLDKKTIAARHEQLQFASIKLKSLVFYSIVTP